MEPRIQYATTSDGLHIAYAVSGSGPVLISVPGPPDNHIQLEWEHEERRHSIELFSAHRTLVRFDGRGTGLSDREAPDFSLEARLRDLDAVVEKLGTDTFALASGGHGNQLSVAYAALHPDRVTHLAAVNPFIHGQEIMSPSSSNSGARCCSPTFASSPQPSVQKCSAGARKKASVTPPSSVNALTPLRPCESTTT